MTLKTSDNHAKAPICAAFVKLMREVFGEDVKVLYVKEGKVLIGEPQVQVRPYVATVRGMHALHIATHGA